MVVGADSSAGTLAPSGPYLSLVAILVESFALESVWGITAIILYGFNNPSYILFMANDSTIKVRVSVASLRPFTNLQHVQVISYLLVVYRIATGRGWTNRSQRDLTSLQWNRGLQADTGEPTSGVCSQIPVNTVLVAKDSTSVIHSEQTV